MSRRMRGAWLATVGAVVTAGLAGWWTGVGCGGGGSSTNGCDPPCAVTETCVNDICEPNDATDAVDTPDDVLDLLPDEAADEAAGEEVAPEAVDEGRSEVDAAGSTVGAACTADTDCRAPGEPLCVTTLVVFGRPWEWTNGYCSSTCDAADIDSCGPGYVCLSIPLITWLGCLKGCTPGTPGECREAEGYTCLDSASIPGGFLPAPICAPQLL